ncbi:MAG: hypothetical protein ACYCOU_04810 [Sulfobacillus sp.]
MLEKIDQTQSATLELGPQLGSLMNRYTDAYRQAHFIDRLGSIVKKIGIGVGGAIFLMGLAVFSALFSSPFGGSSTMGGLGTLFFAAFFAVLAWFFFFVAGTLISAAGQFLLASLDEAVNNSPFIDNPQRAAIMGL